MSNKWKPPFEFVSIPPHLLLPGGQMTQQYHLFFRLDHCVYYTLGEAKRQLAARLHLLKDKDRYFIQWQCIPNCPIWKTAEAIMDVAADKPIALMVRMQNDQISFQDHNQAKLKIFDAVKAIDEYLKPTPPLHNRRN